MNFFEEGSVWRKWDMHIHTPMSALNNQFNISSDDEINWNNYIHELFTRAIANDIHAIGLTDYYSIDGYEKVKEIVSDDKKLKEIFKEEINKEDKYLDKIKEIALFPNIELRLTLMVIYNDSKQSKVEAHVLFDNQLSIDEIKENFLGKLTLKTEMTVSGGKEVSFTRRNLENLGKKIKSEQKEFSDKSDYEAGCNVAYVDFDELKELLRKNFLHKSILLLVEDDITNISWKDQGHLVRKNHYAQCDGLMSSNPNTIKWGLSEETKKEFSSYKPCFWGSDAHKYEKMFKPDKDRFCWIKADLTFEGLRQVLINPHDRIFIGKIVPELDNYLKNKPTKLKEVKINKRKEFKNKKTWFDADIKLNPYMTTIIGNKGSGKSALSDIIALVCNSKNIEHASFLNKERFRKTPENYADDYEATIWWADNEKSEKKSLAETVDESAVELVQFLPQRYIEKVCSGIGDEFKKEIEKTIFSYMDIADKEGCTNLTQLIEKKTASNYLSYQKFKNELEKINVKINELENKKTKEHQQAVTEKLNNLNLMLERHLNAKPTKVEPPTDEQNDRHTKLIKKLDEKYKEIEEDYNLKINQLKKINEQLTDINNFLNEKDIVLKNIDDFNTKFKMLSESLSIKNEKYITLKINDAEFNQKTNQLLNDKIVLSSLTSTTEVELNKVVIPIDFDINSENIKKSLEEYKSLYSKLHFIFLIKKILIEKTSLESQNYQKYIADLKAWEEKRKQIIGEIDGLDDGSIKLYMEEKKYIENQLDKDLCDLYHKRLEIVSNIYEMHIKNCDVMKEIYKPIEIKLKDILEIMEEKINFDVQVVPKPDLKEEILNKVDQRVSGFFYGKQAGNSKLNDLIDKTVFNNREKTLEFVSDIYKVVTENIDETHKVLNNKVVEFYNYIGSLEYLESIYALKLGDKDLKQLLPG